MTQVRNHLSTEQRRKQEERTRIRVSAPGGQPNGALANANAVVDGLPGHFGYHALRGVGLAGLKGFKRAGRRYAVGGEVFRLPANGHALNVAETLFRITEVGSVVLGSRSSDRSASVAAGAAFGFEAVDRLARWNRLQQVLFRASLGLLLNIQSTASADLDAAFAAFERDFSLRSLERRMTSHTGAEGARFRAALAGATAAPADTLAADLARHAKQIVAMRNQRAVPAAQQLAEAERRRRAAEAERRRRAAEAERQRLAAAEARRRAEEAERRWLEEEEEWQRELELRAERRRRQPNAWDMFNDLVNQGASDAYQRWEREQRSAGQGGIRCRDRELVCSGWDDECKARLSALPVCPE